MLLQEIATLRQVKQTAKNKALQVVGINIYTEHKRPNLLV